MVGSPDTELTRAGSTAEDRHEGQRMILRISLTQRAAVEAGAHDPDVPGVSQRLATEPRATAEVQQQPWLLVVRQRQELQSALRECGLQWQHGGVS